MIRKHTVSFKNAFEGVVWVVKTQHTFRTHLLLSALALLASWYLKVSYAEFLTVTIIIMVGLSIEMVNTAIEEATDAIDKSWREDIKVAKDVAAGAMLVYSIGAFIIACVIFLPRILSLL